MTRIFCVRGYSARRLARLQLQIHRKQHDARDRLRTELILDRGVDWLAMPFDGCEGDGARGIGVTDQNWFGRLRTGMRKANETDNKHQSRRSEERRVGKERR